VNTTSFVVDTGKNTVGAGAALAMSIKGLSAALLLLCLSLFAFLQGRRSS
jgi:hypothetical protein